MTGRAATPIAGAGCPDVEIAYRATEGIAREQLIEAEATLSSEERRQRDRLRAAEDRRDYAAAHDLLRRSLSRHAGVAPDGWRFAKGANGKPYVDGPPALSFNLSHTRGLVACGVGFDLPIGIDVERTDRPVDIEAIAGRCFSRAEIRAIVSRRDDARASFFELWTLKEAFIKAIGVGLAQPLNTMSFALDEEGSIIFDPPDGFSAADWRFALFAPSPNTRLAVAVRCRGDRDLWVGARSSESDRAPALQPVATTLRVRACG